MPNMQKQVPYKVCSLKVQEIWWEDLILTVKGMWSGPTLEDHSGCGGGSPIYVAGEESDHIRMAEVWHCTKRYEIWSRFYYTWEGKQNSMKR